MRRAIFCRRPSRAPLSFSSDFLARVKAALVDLVWAVTVVIVVGLSPRAAAQNPHGQGSLSNAASAPIAGHAPMIRKIGPDGLPLTGPQGETLGPNWSGYVLSHAVTGQQYTSAQGSWT